MSRARPKDNLSAVSLFPFLAVLLCTMGTLLVVLVGVSRSSRDTAMREIAEQRGADATTAAEDPAEKARLDHVALHLEKLAEVREEAARQLRDDKARLGHLEDHIRRLQEQLAEAELAVEEMEAAGGEQLVDHKQAERETQRLHALVVDARAAIQRLREELASKKRSFAIVPYKGPNGTQRRPIYIECRENDVVIQPEETQFLPDDFLEPLGPGNPLASAVRAAMEHIARTLPEEQRRNGGTPYALLLIHPESIQAYHQARKAIETAGLEFGYQFVPEDWNLEFPAADPELANVQYRAAENARVRQQLLAAAAPRVYGDQRKDTRAITAAEMVGGPSGRFAGMAGTHAEWKRGDVEDGGGKAATAADEGQGEASASQGAPRVRAGGVLAAKGREQGAGSRGQDDGGANNSAHQKGSSANAGGETSFDEKANSGPKRGLLDDVVAANGRKTEQPPPASVPANETGTASGISQSVSAGQLVDEPGGFDEEDDRPVVKESRGHDWWYRNRDPSAVPIRRTVQVIVRADRLSILPVGADKTARGNGGKEIRLKTSTEESLEEFASALREHVRSWGSAGNGLEWRPILELNVGPDGSQRAEDLRRLLANSGVEVRQTETAKRNPGASSDATR